MTAPGLTRRQFLDVAAGAVAAGIAATLAGCEDTVRGTFARVNMNDAGLTTGKQKVASLAALTDQPVEFKVPTADGGEAVFAYKQGETVVVLSSLCTHRGCAVAWEAGNKRFQCPCHDGTFDIAGKVIAGPPPAPLKTYAPQLEGGEVYILG